MSDIYDDFIQDVLEKDCLSKLATATKEADAGKPKLTMAAAAELLLEKTARVRKEMPATVPPVQPADEPFTGFNEETRWKLDWLKKWAAAEEAKNAVMEKDAIAPVFALARAGVGAIGSGLGMAARGAAASARSVGAGTLASARLIRPGTPLRPVNSIANIPRSAAAKTYGAAAKVNEVIQPMSRTVNLPTNAHKTINKMSTNHWQFLKRFAAEQAASSAAMGLIPENNRQWLLQQLQKLRKFFKKNAAMGKDAAKFTVAMRALMGRSPQAFNKYLGTQGVKPITPANYSDTSFLSAMQGVKQNRGPVPASRPHKPGPFSREDILANPSNVHGTLFHRLKPIAETTPPHLREMGKPTTLHQLDDAYKPTEISGRAFTGPTRVDASKPGTRITALTEDGVTPATDIYMTPTPSVAATHGPAGNPNHSGLYGIFDNSRLNPVATVEVPGQPGQTMPAWTNHLVDLARDPNTVQNASKSLIKRSPELLSPNQPHPNLLRPDPKTGIPNLDYLHEGVMRDFKDVQPNRLFKMVGEPLPAPNDPTKAKSPAWWRPDHAIQELDLNNLQYDHSKYLKALSKQYGVDIADLEHALKQLSNELPATW